MTTADLVRYLWQGFADHDWTAARAVLDDRFACDWPQTGERFGSADSFIAMNRAHPAPGWRIRRIDVLEAVRGEAAARVVVPTERSVDVCLGFYTSAGGLLTGAVEYWTEHADAPSPEWRAQWTGRMPASPPDR